MAMDPAPTLAPLVSVCIANYNGNGIIGPCIDSVLNQATDAALEVIVHDDASTDDSLQQIRAYDQIRLIESRHNLGYCQSNNRMVEAAKGAYLLLLNNDATLLPDAIEALVRYSRRYPNDILTLPQYADDQNTLLDTGMLVDLFCNPVPVTESQSPHRAMAMGACLWIPRHIWQACGGLPPWFGSMAEDMYVCFFARSLGYSVQCVPESGYIHAVGHSFGGGKVVAEGLSSTYRRRALSERNKTFVMLIFYPAVLLMLVLPLHVAALAVECALLCVARRSLRPFKEIYLNIPRGVFANLTRLRTTRSRFQGMKAGSFSDMMAVVSFIPYKLAMLFKHGLPKLR